MNHPFPGEGRGPCTELVAEPVHASSAQKEVARLLGQPARRASPDTTGEARPARTESPPVIAIAWVLEQQPDGRVMLRLTNGRTRPAALAASCLLRPAPGDQVSLLVHGESAWVTSVLTRDPARPAVLDLGSSSLAVRARAISLQAETELCMTAHQLASRATVSVATCEDRYAHVTGTDSSQARCTLIKATGHLGLHAGDTSITAEALIKVDAGQVHMC